MASLKVYPLHVGTITREVSNFCPGGEPQIVDLPLICWFIEGSNKTILVDTGGGEPSEVPRQVHPYRRDKHQTVENALRRIGMSPEDLDIVIVTHMHWDHCGEIELFPKARIIVQADELRSTSVFPIPDPGAAERIKNIDYSIVSGDTAVAKGVKTLLTPGHTHGLQGVLVEGERGPIFIASDTFPLFKNLESDPPTISDIYVDIEQYHTSITRISRLSAFILPAHDFRVFDQEVYS